MLLNEIINEVGMTKRAVKYYEEKGLLSVDKGLPAATPSGAVSTTRASCTTASAFPMA